MLNNLLKKTLLLMLLITSLFAEDKKATSLFNSSQDLYEMMLKDVKAFEGDFLKEIPKDDMVIVKKWSDELQKKLATFNDFQKTVLGDILKENYSKEVLDKTFELMKIDQNKNDKEFFNLILPSHLILFIAPRIEHYKRQDFVDDATYQIKIEELRKEDLAKQKIKEEQAELEKDILKISQNKCVDERELKFLKTCKDSYYNQNIPNEMTIDLLLLYIESYPNSPLIPSIYFHVGYIYSSGYKIEENEILAKKYYILAKNAYKGKYSNFLEMAWSSLVNRADSNINDRIEYLRYMYNIVNSGTQNDFYPYREFPVITLNSVLIFTNDELLTITDNYKKNIGKKFLYAGEVNVLWRTKEKAELELLIKEFPDKEIAKKAQEKLRKLFPETKVQEVVKVTNNEQIPEKENIVKNIEKSQKGKVFLILGFLLILGLFIFMRIKRKKISK